MTLVSVLVFLAIGAVAGWLAGLILKGGGFGLVLNIIIGIIGGIIGGWLFGSFFGDGWVGQILTALVGALILLFVASLIKKK